MYISSILPLDCYYIGQTSDLKKRLEDHLNSQGKYTKVAKDWQLVYSEVFDTRSLAIKRELEIKRKKSRKYIEYLISLNG